MFSGGRFGSGGFFNLDMAQKRQKLKDEIDLFLKDETKSVQDLFAMDSTEK